METQITEKPDVKPDVKKEKSQNDYYRFLYLLSLGKLDMVKCQLANGMAACINVPNNEGDTALHKACCAKVNSVEMAKLLIKAGAKIDVPNKKGRTPLFPAVFFGNISLVKLLISHGADINIQERAEGCTPLFWASARRDKNMVRVLLKNGANQDVKNLRGEIYSKYTFPSVPTIVVTPKK